MRLKLAVEQDWPKSRPVDRLPAWRVQNAIEGIRILCSVLADKRRVEQNVCETGAATEWRLGAELLEHQLLDWVVKHAPAHANAGFAGTAQEFAHPARRGRRAPG